MPAHLPRHGVRNRPLRRPRLAALVAVAPALLAAVSHDGARRPSTSPADCTNDTWSAPVALASGPGTSQLVRLPSVAPFGDGFVVVGNRQRSLQVAGRTGDDDPSLPLFIGFRSSANGTVSALAQPAAPVEPVLPRIGTSSDGRLHLLWFEPDSGDRGTFPPRAGGAGTFQELSWTGRAWSTPRRLFTASQVRWDDFAGSDIVESGLGLLVAVGASRVVGARTGDAIVLGQILGDSIAIHGVPAGGGMAPAYVSVAATMSGEIVIAFLGEGGGASGAAPLVVRSSDAGRSWSTPSPLPNDPPGESFSIRVLTAPDSTMYAVWTQSPGGSAFASSIRAVASRDGGRSWTPPTDFRAGHLIYEPRVAVDRCGTIHVIYSTVGDSGVARMGHLTLTRGRWHDDAPLPAAVPNLDPALTRLADSSLVLVWSQADSATREMFKEQGLVRFGPDMMRRLPRPPRFETVYSILAAPRNRRAPPP